MDTATRNTTIWWVLGALVVLGLIWFLVSRGDNPGIPNTGTDTATDTSTLNIEGDDSDDNVLVPGTDDSLGSPDTAEQSKG